MSLNDSNSHRLYREALDVIPGGVNSPVRALRAVGRAPIFIERAQGSRLYDVDGNEYVDFVNSWGTLILGHTNPDVLGAVREALNNGTSYGAPTELEVRLAQEIVSALPSMDKVRMVNSGTEAVMSAIRLARAFSKEDKIVKFEGCYHGHVDSMLVKAGSGATTLSVPDSQGVTKDEIRNTITTPFNDIEALKRILRSQKDIAAVIIEPVACNMGVIPPKDDFLEQVRELTQESDVLLIFDEVITGFRLCYGGAQDYYGVEPDMTCLGKIIGGGFPVGAYSGRDDIMDLVAPDGPVYQAGTLSGNPIAMTAGLKTLELLKNGRAYKELKKKMDYLRAGIPTEGVFFSNIESMFTIFFTPNEVYDYKTAKESDTKAYATLFNGLLENGVYFPPSQFESAFLSTAHTKDDLGHSVDAIKQSLKIIR